MEKQRKIKIIGIVALIVAVLGITIAFAALSKTLRINGSGKVDPANWDIHFKNVTFLSKSTTATTSGTPAPSNTDKGPTITGLTVTLKQPGDYVKYTADIKNEGDIDAEISIITPPELTQAQSQLFDFKVEYTQTQSKGTKEIEQGDRLNAGETKNITITFSYKDITDETLLPSTAQPINLQYSILYVQSFGTTTTTTQAPSNSSSADTYELGDKFCLNNNAECFYTISDNGDTVTALSEWNLNTTTGMQSSSNATTGIPFSDDAYWMDGSGNIKNEYPVLYKTIGFIYDSNSNLYEPVQNYQTYLRNILGKTSVTATLLSYEQASSFGCDDYDVDCSVSTPSWVSLADYWLGSSVNSMVMTIVSDGPGETYLFTYGPQDHITGVGIRPVITINKSEI